MKRPPRANPYRTAWAGDVRKEHVGQELRAAGWVHRWRDHGGLIFIDLRDRSGILQLVFHPENAAAYEAAQGLRSEDVLSAVGKVVAREERNVNPNMPTGEVELDVTALDLLADSETPPFPVDEDAPVGEDTRLRYRYIDLRRENMVRNLELRHEVVQAIRTHMHEHDFLEIETPILTKSTPEGARDYLVPSRVQRRLVRAAAVAAALQADPDDLGLRALLPDRSLLPRRGPAGRSPARVHAARPRDVVRRRGGRDLGDGRSPCRRLPRRRSGGLDADRTAHL
jgi:hypothetical protein